MATKKFSGNSNYQLEVIPTVSGNSVSLTVRVRRLTGYGYWKGSPGPDYSGSIDGTPFSGSWTYDFQGGTELQSVTTRSKSGMTPGTKSWSVTVAMSSGIGSATISDTFTVAPDAPTSPLIGTPVRNSDSSVTVNWTRRASVAAPYDSQQIQRRVFTDDWSSWTAVATLTTDYSSTDSMSRADTSTSANRAYQYRVKASNAKGSATSAATDVIHMTPGTPSAVKATKTAAGGIKLDVSHTVRWSAHSTEVQRSIDGGSSWTALATLASGVTSYTWASPPAGETVVFRARAVNTAGAGLSSGWRVSNAVPLAAPPAVPSKLEPNGAAFNADIANTVTWQHNTTDTSDQEAYQLQWRLAGAGSWTTLAKTSTGVSAHTFAAGTFTNGGSYEWQVRTWGVHETASPWSATATFITSAPPEVAIVSPEGSLGASLVTVAWEYFDPETTTQSGWQAALMQGGMDVEFLTGTGENSATFTTRLDDATEYQIRVRVRDGARMWSEWDTVTFTTDFPLPPKPTLTLSWDREQGAVIAEIVNPAPGAGQVAAVSNTLYWSLDGDEWRLAESGAMLNTATADMTAPVGMTVDYKVVAWSDLPSSSESDVVSIVTPNDIGYWTAGDGLVVPMEYGNGGQPRVDFTAGLNDKVLHYFAGRQLPVEVSGEARSRVGSVSFMSTSREQLRAIREMQFLPAPHLVRIPDGTFLFCSVSDVRESNILGDLYDISFTATEVSR